MLPSSLQILCLHNCGDVSAWVPSCLHNLASLAKLKIIRCQRIKSIPGNLWSNNFTSLMDLEIDWCEDIESVGGENAISEIIHVAIRNCPKLQELEQPMLRGSYVVS